MIWPVVLLAGCSKSGGTVKPKTVAGLTGTYTVYKFADTTFYNSIRADGVSEITVETLYGDTVYSGIGSAHPHTGVNTIVNYTPQMIADTIDFKTATTAIARNLTDTTTITYSLLTGAYNDGSPYDPTFHIKLTQIDATTIKIVAYQEENGLIGDVAATLYRKQ